MKFFKLFFVFILASISGCNSERFVNLDPNLNLVNQPQFLWDFFYNTQKQTELNLNLIDNTFLFMNTNLLIKFKENNSFYIYHLNDNNNEPIGEGLYQITGSIISLYPSYQKHNNFLNLIFYSKKREYNLIVYDFDIVNEKIINISFHVYGEPVSFLLVNSSIN